MSKRARTDTKAQTQASPVLQNLRCTRGGSELYESLSSLSADLVWIVACYATPTAPEQLTQELRDRTNVLFCNLLATNIFNGHKCRIGFNAVLRRWAIGAGYIGFSASGLVCSAFQTDLVADWAVKYRMENVQIERYGRILCPDDLWDQLCKECGSVKYRQSLTFKRYVVL